jgi:DNA-binding IclR family transcriptional regulator
MREESSRMQETTNARLLGWLLAYPASSAPELASVFGLHPATVYRHLAEMLAAGWLERVSGYGGDARFLLAPRGTAGLAQALHQDTDQLSRMWQRGLHAPARLLPRLPTLDHLHTFARHLFQHAPHALARQGHPVVVRWHLMRDWHVRVGVTPGRAITAQAQAVLAWTVAGSRNHDAAVSTWATESKPPAAARWQTALLLLESGLCDADLITARLRALLRYRTFLERECAAAASSFAPLLVLVYNERQAQVWRRAADGAAHRENAQPLAGVMAIMSQQENPWQWAWRELATGAQRRLASYCASLPATASNLPEGVQAHLAAVQNLLQACSQMQEVTTERPVVQAGRGKRGERQASRAMAWPSPVLLPRQQEVLTQLARTPQMTAEELAAVLPRIPDGEPLAPASVERLLRDLARQRLVERDLVVQGQQAHWRWRLTESGLGQLAAMHQVSVRHLWRLRERDRFLMQRQGAHQAGVYGVIAAFHRAAQASQGAFSVLWWECGRGAERSYRYHGVQRNLRPDAELELALRREGEGVSRLRLWLEYDTGSMNQRDLSRKMAAYRDYWFSRAWAAEGLTALPRLCFIVPHAGQEEHVRRACCALLTGVRLRVLVTTAAHLLSRSPYGSIWRQVFPELVESERTMRRALWEERRAGEREGLIGLLPLATTP